MSLAANAADVVEIDGIYYNLIAKAKQAEVTKNPNKYSETIIIPEKVNYNGVVMMSPKFVMRLSILVVV